MASHASVDNKRTQLKATKVVFPLDDGWYPEYANPGEVEPRTIHNDFMLACPGCGRVSVMRVGTPKPQEKPSWEVQGDINDPTTMTLHPSINCVGCCGWHGYLRNGVFQSC